MNLPSPKPGFYWQKITEWHWPLRQWKWNPKGTFKDHSDLWHGEGYWSFTKQFGPLVVAWKTKRDGEV